MDLTTGNPTGSHADAEPLDPEAVRILTDNHLRFRNFLLPRVESAAVAEDILQHSVLMALRHGAEWGAKEDFVAWFYRILRNGLTDHYRSKAADARKAEAIALRAEASHPESASPEQGEREQLCACFETLLPGLKPEYADLIRRVDLGGEDPSRVAEGLGISYNNLSVRLHRARQSLRSQLEKACGICTRHGCLDCTCGHNG